MSGPTPVRKYGDVVVFYQDFSVRKTKLLEFVLADIEKGELAKKYNIFQEA